MHSTPVIKEIRFIIKKENKTTIRPSNACISVFLADSSFFGSPPELMYLYPLAIRRTKHTTPTKVKSAVIIFAIIAGIQERVATPSGVTHPETMSFH